MKKSTPSLLILFTSIILFTNLIYTVYTYFQAKKVDLFYPSHEPTVSYRILDGSATTINITGISPEKNCIEYLVSTEEDNKLWLRDCLLMHFPAGKGQRFDLSHYDNIVIEMDTLTVKTIDLQIETKKENVAENDDLPKDFCKHAYISVSSEIKRYTISLEHFKVCPGWIMKNRISQYDERLSSYSTILSGILLETGGVQAHDVKSQICVNSIGLTRDPLKRVLLSLRFFPFISVFFIALLINRTRKDKSPEITYSPCLVNPQSEKSGSILYDYMKENYSNHDLNLELLSQGTGIKKRDISLQLKEQYEVSFKELLNAIRIEKAIQLLQNEDLKIIDIADMVGYSSLPHFNLCFKQITGKSPTDYRRSLSRHV